MSEHDELVEKVAKRIALAANGGDDDASRHGIIGLDWMMKREKYVSMARAAIAVMPTTGDNRHDIEKRLVDALRVIAVHEVVAPLTQNDDNVSLSDLPFYVAGKAHAELGILHNIARNALDAYEARPLGDGWPSISPELIEKLNKLATYLTEQGEYEACDLIDTVVERLTPPPEEKQ